MLRRFFPRDPVARDMAFRVQLLAENARRARMLAWLVIGFELVLTGVCVVSMLTSRVERFFYVAYILMYLSMVLASGLGLLALRWFKRRLESRRDMDHAFLTKSELCFSVYIIVIMCWGAVITLLDQQNYGHLMVFMVNMLTCSLIFCLPARWMAAPFALSTGLLAAALPFFQRSGDVLIGHYTNLVIFVVLSWVASRALFGQYCRYYASEQQLKREVRRNEQINRRMESINAQLREMSLVDELTGVGNRRSFRSFIDGVLEDAGEDGRLFSVIMVDVDYFKEYNDRFGHVGGDYLLKSVSERMEEAVGSSGGFVARWGGDEFICAVSGVGPSEVERMSNALLGSVRELKLPHPHSRAGEYASVSIGCCTGLIRGRQDVSLCIERADEALYRAKELGRNQVSICDAIENLGKGEQDPA